MNKEMILSSTSHETRVAILEDDHVVEVFIEREHSRGVVGNIYKGRVSKVLPGMQSAFVDLGLERDAFLYVSDVISPTEEALEDEDEPVSSPVEPAAPDGDGEPHERVQQDGAPAPSEAPAPTSGNGAPGQDAQRQQGRPDRRPRERTLPTAKIE